MKNEGFKFNSLEEVLDKVEFADHDRLIRVKTKNASKLCEALRQAGYEAEFLGPGTHYTHWDNGCEDPGCCFQHPEATKRDPDWGCIKTNASGTKSHKIWVKAGIVE